MNWIVLIFAAPIYIWLVVQIIPFVKANSVDLLLFAPLMIFLLLIILGLAIGSGERKD